MFRRLPAMLDTCLAFFVLVSSSACGNSGDQPGDCCSCTCAKTTGGGSCSAGGRIVKEHGKLDCNSVCAGVCSDNGCPKVTSVSHCDPSEEATAGPSASADVANANGPGEDATEDADASADAGPPQVDVPSAAEGEFGWHCGEDSECLIGLCEWCGESGVCTKGCKWDDDCPEGWACQKIAARGGVRRCLAGYGATCP